MTGVLTWYRTLSIGRRALAGTAFIIIAIGLYLTVMRYVYGLGRVTNLSDEFPWGFWIGFDVMSGVALAAGGFTLCTIVYIFGYKWYKNIVRATVLTAFLGYILVAVGLLYDLGKYFNIWHPIVMWNHHSVMFEVAWCVILYSIVLALEFAPVVLEKFEDRWDLSLPLAILRRLSLPIVIVGVLLSTLHQSSLGSLFLIVPDKLHPLWYTPILPLLFFLSAVAVGPAMVIVESCLSSRLFRRGLEIQILSDLSRFLLVAILVYLGVRIQDLFVRGVTGEMFAGTFESVHFLIENGLFLAGALILAIPGLSSKALWLPVAAILVVLGTIYNRLSVSWFGMLRSSGSDYSPAWSEFAISAFLVTLGALAFYFIVKHFDVFPEIDESEDGQQCLKN